MDLSVDNQALARRRLLGWGIASELVYPGIDLGRDLRLRRGPNGVDLQLAEGIDCLAQDLSIALTTLLGSDLLNTAFGFDGVTALAEESASVVVQERVRVAVVAVLGRDPRVRRIVDVKFEDGRLEAPVAGRRDLAVRVAFETLTDDRVAIDLGGLAPVA